MAKALLLWKRKCNEMIIQNDDNEFVNKYGL